MNNGSLFDEVLKSDIGNVFLNGDEFAEQITIAGVTTLALVDDVSLDYPEELADGLRVQRKNVIISDDVLVNTPALGREIEFNDESWVLDDIISESGTLLIKLKRKFY